MLNADSLGRMLACMYVNIRSAWAREGNTLVNYKK